MPVNSHPAPSACLLGMFHRHLEHKVRRDFEELGVAAAGLQDQRHHVEAAVLGFPAQVDAQLGTRQASESADPGTLPPLGSTVPLQGWIWYLGELHAGRVPSDGAIRHLVAGIADELGVPDPEVVLPIAPLGEHSDGRPSPRQGQCCLPPGSGGGSQPSPSGPLPLPVFPPLPSPLHLSLLNPTPAAPQHAQISLASV